MCRPTVHYSSLHAGGVGPHIDRCYRASLSRPAGPDAMPTFLRSLPCPSVSPSRTDFSLYISVSAYILYTPLRLVFPTATNDPFCVFFTVLVVLHSTTCLLAQRGASCMGGATRRTARTGLRRRRGGGGGGGGGTRVWHFTFPKKWVNDDLTTHHVLLCNQRTWKLIEAG
jgi:hypothetical protein